MSRLNKENVTLINSGEIQGETVPAKKKKVLLAKSKNEQPLNNWFNMTIGYELL